MKADEEKTAAEELQESENELVEATQERLNILNGDVEEEEDDDQTEESEEESESTPAEETTEEEEEEEEEEEGEQADEEEEEEESTSEEEATEEKTEVDGLPEAYMRAAVHQGWDEKEVKEFFEASPEVAMKTFAKIHESTNKLSAEFARLGRVEPVKETPAKTATEANKATEEDETLKMLKEEYGEDSTMVKAFATMQDKLAEATKVQEVVKQPEPDSSVQATVDKFFTDPSLKPYVNFYGEGKDADKLTVGQMNNRWAMLEMADRIIAGSEKQGREVTPEAAMEMAHLSVSEKHRTEALRTELKSKVKKRAKGVTLKPKKGKKVVSETDAKKSEKQLESSVSAKLKSMF